MATCVLAVLWRVISLMRYAFGILFTHNFDKPADGTRHPLIQSMIDNVQLATYITYHLCSVMVCCIFYVFIILLMCAKCTFDGYMYHF